MNDKRDVLVVLRGEEESWTTSFVVTEDEALGIRNLSTYRTLKRAELPSIDGFAQVNHGNLEIHYRSRNTDQILSAAFSYAQLVVDQAIAKAMIVRRSHAAHNRIWEWIHEHYSDHDVAVLILEEGESVDAILLTARDEHIAIQRPDGSIAIGEVVNEEDMPVVGSSVSVIYSPHGQIVMPLSSLPNRPT